MPDSNPKKIFTAKVFSIKELIAGVKEITFKIDEPFAFIPGQYVWLDLANVKIPDPRGTKRAFSISSLPNKENTIAIVGRISESGFKKAMWELKEGDSASIRGPFGSLRFPEDSNVPVVCVAGGVGIAPFVSLIPDSLNKFPSRKVTLITTNRAGQKAPYSELFQELTKNPNFNLIAVEGQAKLETLEGVRAELSDAQWIVTGLKDMVFSVASLLYSMDIREEKITFDEFYFSKDQPKQTASPEEILPGLFPVAMDQASNHVILTDIDGYIIFANRAAEEITGYSFSEMQGQTPRLWGGLMSPEFYKKLWHTIKVEKKPVVEEIRNIRKNGEYYDVLAHISPLTDKDGALIGFMGTEEDITKLKQIDRMKTEFVSLSSHQLRTPLTAIKWGLEAFTSSDTANLTDKQKEQLDDINSSTLRMIDLVNSLLNVSRIESGRIIISPVPTNIVKLANDVVGRLKIEMAKKNISLMMNVADNLPEINLDQSLIANVYQNLITNATSYSPEGSKIELAIKEKDGEIISSVKDEGIGIPEEEKGHIFEKFYRTAGAKKVRPDGSGLGLYIVKSIVESSGGKIWFESSPGAGTTFYFSLPTTGMKPKAGEVTLS